jgi:hypothetical protein
MHAAGYLSPSDGSLYNRGSYGFQWSSTQHSATGGWNLYFYSANSDMNYSGKANGFPVRCLKE